MKNSNPDKSTDIRKRLERLNTEMEYNFSVEKFKTHHDSKDNKSLPKLQVIDRKKQPHILILDNELDFLTQIKLAWEIHYPDSFTLHPLHLGTDIKNTTDVINYIKLLKNENSQPVFLFVDRHHDCFRIDELLKEIYADKRTRYIPIAIMTTDITGMTEDSDYQYITAHALRILYNKRSHPYFLYECFSILAQLESEVEERKWADLREDLAKNIANNVETRTVLQKFQDFLEHQLNIELGALRALQGTGILTLYLPPINKTDQYFPEKLDIKNIPFYNDLIDHKRIIIENNLSEQQVGTDPFSPPQGYHLLAATLLYESEVLAVLTLFRKPDAPTFRYQDAHRLLPAVMELSAYLGQRKNQEQLSRRQQDLLAFVEKVDTSFNENEILKLLAKHLHRIIHHNDNNQSKTTLRLLASGTGELISKVDLLGLSRDEEKNLDIYNPCSTYATAVKEGKTVFYDDINKYQAYYCPTRQGLNACMTVPLLASGNLRLGAVNLEHTKKKFYTKSDKIYAESLCRIAANALLRLRANEFKLGLIKLIKELNQPLDSDITSTIYKLLYNYFRYAVLVELVPSESIDMPWRISKVMRADKDDNLYPVSAEEFDLWQDNINRDWENTFVKKVIHNEITERFTNTDTDFKQKIEQLKIQTESEAAMYLSHKKNVISDRAILLLFPVKDALNQEQVRLFKHFCTFLSTIFKHKNETLGYFIQTQISELEAILGKSAQQMRHSLTNQLGGLNNGLNSFEKQNLSEDSKNNYIKKTRKILTEIDHAINESRRLTKIRPEYNMENITQIWHETKTSLSEHAFLQNNPVLISDLEEIHWQTDKDYLKAVFTNLLQNALESGESLSEIIIHSKIEKNILILSVCNNGEPIPKDVQKTLFTMGHTTKNTGTGFGLYYCRYLMQKMDGEIFYQHNNVNNHTCFILHLSNRSHDV